MEKSLKGGAFGWPGAEPRWARSNKTGVGTAYSASSDIWFTLWNGIVTELYHPTIDRPQIRDLQYLISDGKTFLHQERSDTDVLTTRIADHGLGYRCVVKDPRGRYTITKDIICAPHSPCLLLHTRFKPRNSLMAKRLSLYVLCAPHLELGGYRNNGYIASVNGQNILMAHKDGRWLAMAATVPFKTLSCGYVGSSDGWTDLKANFQMDYQFSSADDGNIALTGQIDIETSSEFTLGVAFGNSEHQALANLLQSLGVPFHSHLERFAEQWRLSSAHLKPMHAASGDKGHLLTGSFALLHAHEDKAFAGALIASLSIPWGEEKTDSEQGGYHLVWTRECPSARMAALRKIFTLMASRIFLECNSTSRRFPSFLPGNSTVKAPWKASTRLILSAAVQRF
jgi:glucoamylase